MDYTSLKVTDLKKLLKEVNLPLSGTKAELIERLQRNAQNASSVKADASVTKNDDTTTLPTNDETTVISQPLEPEVLNPPPEPIVSSLTTEPTVAIDSQTITAAVYPQTSIPEGKGATVTDGQALSNTSTDAPQITAASEAVGTPITNEDVIKELEKRIARAKKFGLDSTEQEQEVARIRKFGVSTNRLGLNRMDSVLGINKSTTKASSWPASTTNSEKTNYTNRVDNSNKRSKPRRTSTSIGPVRNANSKPLTPEESEKLKKRLERFGGKA
ncbi:hypothetical protein NADFUDRAFT_47807 [Nadsonia fulvescens var. elongata DSM 6958]|uniref:SAP domain-containing protein n=1 Tax=Nadsonia fulvescens var. elongata DSM 6958 TaxID=857566 RepID=A0A1E3PFA1_9ASCO|nr:hypothetical protein NADFUDRAFT_47807 [Nadsonia fulvescens var. elongata DSM 6958]